MMGETLVADGRNVNPKRVITPPREREFGTLSRSIAYSGTRRRLRRLTGPSGNNLTGGAARE